VALILGWTTNEIHNVVILCFTTIRVCTKTSIITTFVTLCPIPTSLAFTDGVGLREGFAFAMVATIHAFTWADVALCTCPPIFTNARQVRNRDIGTEKPRRTRSVKTLLYCTCIYLTRFPIPAWFAHTPLEVTVAISASAAVIATTKIWTLQWQQLVFLAVVHANSQRHGWIRRACTMSPTRVSQQLFGVGRNKATVMI